MPGYMVCLQGGEEIREGLTCAYCRLVLKDPVQTSETGLRLCRECFDKASSFRHDSGLDLDDHDHVSIVKTSIQCITNRSIGQQYKIRSDKWKMWTCRFCKKYGIPDFKAWPDFAVKKEIANLKVKCNNCTVGCDWKGLFKQLAQHSQECQYVTVGCRNPGCGQQVLRVNMELHLKEQCLQRRVNCKSCSKEMCFIDLQDHIGVCSYAPRQCKFCGTTVPSLFKLVYHIMNECKHEVNEFTKMFEAFKEMVVANQQATKRNDELEKRIESLEKSRQEDAQKIKKLAKKNESLEMQVAQNESKIQAIDNSCVSSEQSCDKSRDEVNQMQHEVRRLENDMQYYEDRFHEMEKRSNRDHLEVAACLQDINTATAMPSGDKVVPHEKPSEFMKQVEEKVLEVERTLNVLSLHHSELELQLQASLASTYNGAFLWRIPDVARKIRDARIGRITSIYSPPFYTGRNGYKMCIRAYLNGDGIGERTHLSIFFVLMKGEYDSLLQWPFEHKVSLVLVDQDHMKHLVQTFKPNVQSSSFQKPKTDMNVASGCPEFADLSILDNTSYVKDDVLYIKAIIDTSKIVHP